MAHLLSGLYAAKELSRYDIRQRCSPQPAMRRVQRRGDEFLCWTYQDHEWTLQDRVSTETDAIAFWLSDPWLPNQAFSYGNLSVMAVASDVEDGWSERRWDEAVQAIAFHVVAETGARPHEIGPDSTWTSGRVYQRLRSTGAAAQVYWREGRSRLDDLRGECPVRTDLPSPLRCVVLAEAAVLLLRRPHQSGYVLVDQAPGGVAAEAAALLNLFDVPPRTLDLLVR